MNLSEPFIRRPVMTVLLMVTIFFLGIMSYQRLPVADLPNVDLPTIEVSVSYPGATPETMANSIATPLEQQFMTLEGIKTVFSSSNTGSTNIILTFSLDRDINAASTDVQAAISRAKPNLPSNLPNQPTYKKVNPAATPIIYYVLTSPIMTLGNLYDYADTVIGQRIAMVEGVAQVQTYGSPYAVRIQIDPEKLAAKNIGFDQLVNLVANANVDLPLGTLYGQRDDYTIQADGQLKTAAPYNEIVIKNQNHDLVKIKDVGISLDSVKNDKFFQSYVTKEKNQPCVILAVQRLPGMNTVRIIEKLTPVIEELKPQLPQSLEIDVIYDQAQSIKEEVNDVLLTLFVAFCLVIAIVYLALGKGVNTLIPLLALPMSILGAFSVIYILGFSIDILSLLAITLSIGFLVDDAIVVLENSVRHVQNKEHPMDAALNSSKEISVTVLSITLSLSAAFIPMLFMGGVIGRLFRECAVTIIVAVLFSGFISLSLTSMMASRFVRPYDGSRKTWMERFSERLNTRLKSWYEPCLHWAIKHRLFMVSLGVASIVCSYVLYRALPQDLLPPSDVGFMEGFTQAREGTSPFLMEKYHQNIAKIAMDNPNIDSLLSISSFANSNQGYLFFKLKPYKKRIPLNQVISKISDQYKQIAGVNVFLSPLPLINLTVGTTAQALYQYSLTSIDRKTLYEYSANLTRQMLHNPLFSQVSTDLLVKQPQWSFHILREKAANYNVSVKDIETYLGWAYSDNKISHINGEINQYDVIVETLPFFYRDPTVLSTLYIRSATDALVPLSELVRSEETIGPLTVNHMNGLPTVGISFNPADNVPLGTVLKEIKKITKDHLPPQVGGKIIGTAEIFSESFKSLDFLLLLALFVIYIILGILYESFVHPITVMSALPPALLGGLFSLFLFRQSLSIYSFIGLILLIGIVLKNGIMMIDFANDAVKNKKKSAYDAIVEASLIRFRPILMTTAASLMGAFPIALGIGGAMAKTRMSLGICVVGGLIVSQLLTLLLTPVLYYYFEIFQEKVRAFWERKKKQL
ncbi:MAG TPA: efflux RND transporter permease subunit [Chlamydiales bacterium]|nr:efflux RND transporter permease subunit [Chlamydiales bacterium]